MIALVIAIVALVLGIINLVWQLCVLVRGR
jgi:hypothetical protein